MTLRARLFVPFKRAGLFYVRAPAIFSSGWCRD